MPPPVLPAVHDTLADVEPAVAVTDVGVPGGFGVTLLDAVEAADVPDDPVPLATTVNVYAVAVVRPVTPHEVVADVQVMPPGDEVAV